MEIGVGVIIRIGIRMDVTVNRVEGRAPTQKEADASTMFDVRTEIQNDNLNK